VISGNQFADTNPGAQGAYAVTLAGHDDPESQVTVSDNVFAHRGLMTYRVRELTVVGNTLSSAYASADPVLALVNAADQWTIMGNTIHRLAGARPGAVIRAVHHGASKASTRGVLEGNVLTQDTPFTIVELESARDLTIEGNDLAYTPASTSWKTGFNAIGLRATAAEADGILISGNRLRASTPRALRAAISFDANPQPFGAVSVFGNMSLGIDMGLECHGGGGFKQPIVYAANNWVGTGHDLAYSCPPSVVKLTDGSPAAPVTPASGAAAGAAPAR
jgi:hypothetical protein